MSSFLILASASPQRRSLLEGLQVPFTVLPSSVDERACVESDPQMRSVILARQKAQDIHARTPDAFVLGCDTLVIAPDGSLLEKPRNAAEAREHLEKQSGGWSIVHSALCLIAPNGRTHEGLNSSRVLFKALSDADIDWWVATGLWEERSGSFQIDGPGQLMIEKIEGDWTGIVGLPVFLFGKLAEEAGLSARKNGDR